MGHPQRDRAIARAWEDFHTGYYRLNELNAQLHRIWVLYPPTPEEDAERQKDIADSLARDKALVESVTQEWRDREGYS